MYWRAKMYFSASSASNASHGSTLATLLHLSVQFYLPEKKGTCWDFGERAAVGWILQRFCWDKSLGSSQTVKVGEGGKAGKGFACN